VSAAANAETTAVVFLIAGTIRAIKAKVPAKPMPHELGKYAPNTIARSTPTSQRLQFVSPRPRKYISSCADLPCVDAIGNFSKNFTKVISTFK